MGKKLFLIFIIFLLTNLLVSCKVQSKEKKNVEVNEIVADDYSLRVKNITKYISDNNIIIKDDCTNIFIIQASKCGSCSQGQLEAIKNEFSNSADSKLFILSERNSIVSDFLGHNFPAKKISIAYDLKNELPKYGLYFMKNLYIRYCSDSVSSWKFLGRVD